MAAQSDGSISGAERVLAVLLTPFVVAWDLFRKLVFGYFSVMVRLVGPIVRRVSPVLSGAWRLVVRATEPVLAMIGSSAREIRRAVSPALRSVSRLWSVATAPVRRVTAAVRQRLRLVVDRASLIGRRHNR